MAYRLLPAVADGGQSGLGTLRTGTMAVMRASTSLASRRLPSRPASRPGQNISSSRRWMRPATWSLTWTTSKQVGYSLSLLCDYDRLMFSATVTQWAAERSYPVTNLYTSHYISNFVKFKYLSKQPDGSFTLTIPAPDDCPLINFAVEQTGGWVAAVLRDPKKYIGQRVDACSEVVTVAEWAAAAAEVSGKTIRTLNIPGGEAYIDGTEVKKMVPVEELYLNYLAFYKK
jgi:hypothetical protein